MGWVGVMIHSLEKGEVRKKAEIPNMWTSDYNGSKT